LRKYATPLSINPFFTAGMLLLCGSWWLPAKQPLRLAPDINMLAFDVDAETRVATW
jgi:hypothetical protein